jgi:hypothetical protein
MVVADPSAHRHIGPFLRFDLGAAYTDSRTSPNATALGFDSLRGPGGALSFTVGGAVKENFILGAEFWSSWVSWPTLKAHGASVPSNSLSSSVTGMGLNLTWFLMPANVYLSLTPSVTWLTFHDAFGGYQTNTGFGGRVALGKVWWTGSHWTVGFSGWAAASYVPEGSGASAKWRTGSAGLAFTATVD